MRQLLGGVRRQRWMIALGGSVGAIAGWVASDEFGFTTGSRFVGGAAGMVAGLLAVLVLSMAWQASTRRLNDRSSVEAAFGLPVLAEPPDLEDEFGPPRSLLGGLALADRQLVEPFELLRLSLVDALHPFDPETGNHVRRGVVLLVSPSSSEVSIADIAENLAATLAENGHGVLLIDGDLSSPSLSPELALSGRGRGLLDASASGPLLASGSFDLDHIVEPTDHELMSVVGFGTGYGVGQPGRVMSRVGPFFDAARARYAVTVVAGPVPTVASGGIELARLADRHALVAKTGVTTSADAKRVTALLGQLRLPIDGVVLVGRSPNALLLRRKKRSLGRQSPESMAPAVSETLAESLQPGREAVSLDGPPQPDRTAEIDESTEAGSAPGDPLPAAATPDGAGVIPDDVTGGTLNVRNWFKPGHSDISPPGAVPTTGEIAGMGFGANGGNPEGKDGHESDHLGLLDNAVLEERGDLETASPTEFDRQNAQPAREGDVVEADAKHEIDHVGSGDQEDTQSTAGRKVVIAGTPPLPDDAARQPEQDDGPPSPRDLADLSLELLDGLEDEDELNTRRP